MPDDVLCHALKQRGVKLNSRPDFPLMDSLQKHCNLKMADEIFEKYLSFNGFAEQDLESYLQIWPLARVVEMLGMNYGVDMPAGYTAIGDILMDSEFVICDLSNAQKPVRLLYEARQIGTTYQDFWRQFCLVVSIDENLRAEFKCRRLPRPIPSP